MLLHSLIHPTPSLSMDQISIYMLNLDLQSINHNFKLISLKQFQPSKTHFIIDTFPLRYNALGYCGSICSTLLDDYIASSKRLRRRQVAARLFNIVFFKSVIYYENLYPLFEVSRFHLNQKIKQYIVSSYLIVQYIRRQCRLSHKIQWLICPILLFLWTLRSLQRAFPFSFIRSQTTRRASKFWSRRLRHLALCWSVDYKNLGSLTKHWQSERVYVFNFIIYINH